jgi:hypothetical protein
MRSGARGTGAVGCRRGDAAPWRLTAVAAAGMGLSAFAGMPRSAVAQTTPSPESAKAPASIDTDTIDPRRRFQVGVHLGAGPALGNADDGVSLIERVGVAPTYLVEGFARITPRVSLGLIVGGVASLRSGSCPAKAEGFSCGLTGLGFVAGLVRYHLAPVGRWQPWVGAGPAFGLFGESASRPLPRPSGFCLVGCDGRELTRTTYRYGPEGVLGVGAGFPLGTRVMLGGAVHGIFGAYLRGKTTEKSTGGDDTTTQSFAVSSGAHAVFLATIHLQIGLGS